MVNPRNLGNDHLGDFFVDKRSTGFKTDPNINI